MTFKTRIDARFEQLKSEKRGALVTFITAGDPTYDVSLEILKSLPSSGADVIELGMPFSDPMADGPAIQLASEHKVPFVVGPAVNTYNAHTLKLFLKPNPVCMAIICPARINT